MQKYNSKLYTAIKIALFLVVLFPLVTDAALVPCGRAGQPACEVCHLYKLAKNIIDFLLKDIAIPLLVIALLAAGFYWLTAGGSEERIAKGKTILSSAVIGFIIAFGAWIIVNTILDTLAFKNPFYDTPWTNTNFCARSPIRSDAGPGITIPTEPTGPLPTGTLSHAEAVQRLNGIPVVSTSGRIGCNDAGCTTLNGAPASSIDRLVELQRNCNCTFQISGGTETNGHGRTTEHGPGRGVFDLQVTGGTSYTQLESAIKKTNGASYQCEARGSESSVPCSTGGISHIHVRI